MREIFLISKLTYQEAIRSRWIVYFSIGFSALAFLLSLVGSGETSTFSHFNRSAAMLLNVLLLFIPLLGLTLGAHLISSDRETGAMTYVLSHPVSKLQFFAGKGFGGFLAMAASVSIGFAISGFGIALGGGHGFASFFILWTSSLVLISVCLSVGLLISVVSSDRSGAMALALVSWLGFTIVSDLGLMGTAYVLRLRSEAVLGISVLNPVEAYKIWVVKVLSGSLESLGAGGIYLDFMMGGALPVFLGSWLILVSISVLSVSFWLFQKQEE